GNCAVPGTAAAQGLAVHGQPEQGWSGGGGRLGWLTGGQLGQVGAGGGIEGVAVQTGQQPAQGGGGQPDRGRETEPGAQVADVSGEEPGEPGQECRSAECGEQGERQQRAEPVAASAATTRVGYGIQYLGQRGQVCGRVGEGEVLQVAGEHVDRG